MIRTNEEFPFWRIAAAIMVGNILAAIVVWFALATWARYEANQLAEFLRVDTEQWQAEAIRAQQAAAARQAEQRRQAAAKRDVREGRYMRVASSDIPMGELRNGVRAH